MDERHNPIMRVVVYVEEARGSCMFRVFVYLGKPILLALRALRR